MIGERLHEINKVSYACFMDFEKAYDIACGRKLFEVLREKKSEKEIVERNQCFFLKTVERG